MYVEEDVEFTTGEQHSYFPEWADRPASTGSASVSDRNSYMAGGYAEEFGYCSGSRSPTAFAILKGDPEQSSLWRVQIGGVHPLEKKGLFECH